MALIQDIELRLREWLKQEDNAYMRGITANAPRHRTQNGLRLEGMIEDHLQQVTGGIVERIVTSNPNIFEAPVRRSLMRSAERFAESLAKGQARHMEQVFSAMLGGHNSGAAIPGGLSAGLINQLVGGLLQGVLGGQVKTRTHSYETQRSREVAGAQSAGQQAAEAISSLRKGERNL